MERFVRRQNVEHYREMLKIITDPVQRRMIEKLLLEEEAKIKKAEENRKKKQPRVRVALPSSVRAALMDQLPEDI